MCGSGATKFLCEGRDRIHGVPGIFAQTACADCGAAFVFPQPDAEELARYYPESYEAHLASADGGVFKRIAGRLGLRRKMRYVARFRKRGKLLDVGCGRGNFIQEAQRRGFEAFGVESSPQGARLCRQRGLRVEHCDFDAADAGESAFDVVAMWHVLEHLRDPAGALKKVAAALKPGGWFIFCVPNTASVNARIFGELWSGYDVPRHLFAFSERAVVRMIEKSGLVIGDCRTFFGGFSALSYDLKFWLDEKLGAGVQSKAIRFVARSIFFRVLTVPLMFLIEKLGRGPVITYAARRLKES